MTAVSDLFGGGKSTLTSRNTRTAGSPFQFNLNGSPFLNAGSGGVNLNLPQSFTQNREGFANTLQGLRGDVAASQARLGNQQSFLTGRLNETRGQGNPFMDMLIRPVRQQNAASVANLRQGLERRGIAGSLADSQISGLEAQGAVRLQDATARAGLVNADFERAQLNDLLNVENSISQRVAQRSQLLGAEAALNAEELQQMMAAAGISTNAQQLAFSNATDTTTQTKEVGSDIGPALFAGSALLDNDLVKGALSNIPGVGDFFGLGAPAAGAAAAGAPGAPGAAGAAGAGAAGAGGSASSLVSPAFQATRGLLSGAGSGFGGLFGTGAGSAGAALNSAIGASPALSGVGGVGGAGESLASLLNFTGEGFGAAGAGAGGAGAGGAGAGSAGATGGLGSIAAAAAPLAIAGIAAAAFASKSKARDKERAMWAGVSNSIKSAPKDANGNVALKVGGKTVLVDGRAISPFGGGSFDMADGRVLVIGERPDRFTILSREDARAKYQPTQEDKLVASVRGTSGLKKVKKAEVMKVLAKPVSAITSNRDKRIYFAARDAGFGALGGDDGGGGR